jgi:hypothetical protein
MCCWQLAMLTFCVLHSTIPVRTKEPPSPHLAPTRCLTVPFSICHRPWFMQFVSYKDDSGAMGHCCSMRCFNAPHSYQVSPCHRKQRLSSTAA